MSEADGEGDESLVSRASAGDEAALRTLVERYSERLRGRIEGRLGGKLLRRVAASDVLQEAHLAAIASYAEFEDRGEGSFGRWFRAIVENKIRDVVRRNVMAEKRSVGQEVTRRGRLPTEIFPGKEPSPSQVMMGSQFKESVRSALEELPDSHRQVLLLLQERGMSVEHAAACMNRSPAAVRKLYGRALGRLEGLLNLPRGGGERRRPTR